MTHEEVIGAVRGHSPCEIHAADGKKHHVKHLDWVMTPPETRLLIFWFGGMNGHALVDPEHVTQIVNTVEAR
ncbi:MAG: hypothetical protein H8E27_04780 [Verrucomicrobia subdivision 3 bacterium]|nr:hypothetical protein [Limisphaerales bacterium]